MDKDKESITQDSLEEQNKSKDEKNNSEDSETNYMSLGMCLGLFSEYQSVNFYFIIWQ